VSLHSGKLESNKIAMWDRNWDSGKVNDVKLNEIHYKLEVAHRGLHLRKNKNSSLALRSYKRGI